MMIDITSWVRISMHMDDMGAGPIRAAGPNGVSFITPAVAGYIAPAGTILPCAHHHRLLEFEASLV